MMTPQIVWVPHGSSLEFNFIALSIAGSELEAAKAAYKRASQVLYFARCLGLTTVPHTRRVCSALDSLWEAQSRYLILCEGAKCWRDWIEAQNYKFVKLTA